MKKKQYLGEKLISTLKKEELPKLNLTLSRLLKIEPSGGSITYRKSKATCTLYGCADFSAIPFYKYNSLSLIKKSSHK